MIFSIVLNVVLGLVILGMLIRFRASPICFSKNIPATLRRIYDNIRRGWNRSEWWNLDYKIATFVLPRLKEFRDGVMGHPAELGNNEDFESGSNNNGMIEWKKILDKMIFSFECIKNDNDDLECPSLPFKFVDHEGNYGTLEYEGTPEQIAKHEQDFKVYSNDLKERQKIIQEGLDLFAKYFQGLWD
jgi:hypothetical protein